MENKIKNIVREVPGEQAELSFYFDGDCYNENSGDYNNTVFIVCNDRGHRYGLNIDEYNRIVERAEGISEGFYDVEHKDAWTNYETYKEVMQDWSIDYTSHKCHLLKEWYNGGGDVDDADSIAEFLTITTGKTWDVQAVHGYCQGDYCEVVYCADNYSDKKTAKTFGEVWLGCAKEFCVIDLDENGEETDSCYGYIVADCEAWHDEDYKRLVCEWAGIDPEETRLEMIDSYSTVTKCEYRTA